MSSASRRVDLVAFLGVLVVGVGLVALGVQPEAVSTVAVGLSSLYTAWYRRSNKETSAPNASDESQAPVLSQEVAHDASDAHRLPGSDVNAPSGGS